MKENRKKWTQPQLIVLGRGTPEENVLAGCKTSKLAGSAATIRSCRKFNLTKKKCNRANCRAISATS
jgi:ribosomal protein L6P/L9E